MSIEAISWVFKQEIKPSSLKFVLVALADCADPGTGICWPSIDHIVRATCQDRKTVIKSLDDLESRGWLVDTGKRMGRTNQVKVYRLADVAGDRAATKDCEKGSGNGTLTKESRSSAETVPFFPGKSTENGFPPTPPYRADPSLEPSLDPPRANDLSLFERFWEAFPSQRKGNKDSAAKAWRRAKQRATEEEIFYGAIRYAGSDEVKRGFAKGAAAWLNDDRWAVDYTTPSGQRQPTKDERARNAVRKAAIAGGYAPRQRYGGETALGDTAISGIPRDEDVREGAGEP